MTVQTLPADDRGLQEDASAGAYLERRLQEMRTAF